MLSLSKHANFLESHNGPKERFMCRYIAALVLAINVATLSAADFRVAVVQITHGQVHHFFGYIGHVKTIPWNSTGRYIVALRTKLDEHLPGPSEPADIVLIDTEKNNAIVAVDQTRAWNPQQGTMLYWNPLAPDRQFFFNDRDPATNRVFAVLFDIEAGKRVREFRFERAAIGNSGVAQNGGAFCGLNYGRLFRLRPVTGYVDAFDWTTGVAAPKDDGIFRVDTASGEKQLVLSFAAMRAALLPHRNDIDQHSLFVNHTLWSRDDRHIYFFVRGGWEQALGDRRVNAPFTMRADGSELTYHAQHIGGHPEWLDGRKIIGSLDGQQVIYDTEKQKIVGSLGGRDVFPDPEGDIALSSDGTFFVNGYKDGQENRFVVYRMADGAHVRTNGLDNDGKTSGPLRLDPAPAWNRNGTAFLASGYVAPNEPDAGKKYKHIFVMRIE